MKILAMWATHQAIIAVVEETREYNPNEIMPYGEPLFFVEEKYHGGMSTSYFDTQQQAMAFANRISR